MTTYRILHVTGSPSDDFYYGLSYRNAQCNLNMAPYVPLLHNFVIAVVTVDGQWRFPATLNEKDFDAAKPMSLAEAIQFITTQKIDLVMPHMYCIPGMTQYRALFDMLKIPYMGNTAEVMAIAVHKDKTKAIVAAAGVKVPFGEILRHGDVPTIPPPAIVKPTCCDNSLGMTLVKDASDYDTALKKAFEQADKVIVETFIPPGREVRCGIIVKDGQLISLPIEEYSIDPHERPVRTHVEKFPELDANGKFLGWPKDYGARYWIVDSNDLVTQKVQDVAKKCHVALGCRHYSAFDFRIDPSGEPWFIEAGLYCSFDGGGGIPYMAKTSGISLDELVATMIKETLNSKS
ncbi:unnamed protein product [Adineta ricciae]|uniref:ATP-grasp domain-containing protein n=1 Tax=Adineta ricciae TaxID=249248 RepID=A0A814VMV0_ADIRI|nr:unnamed protein product [Adineta ricciae]CAF1425336.1 unnamed protein product [Adineta ricciae]